MSEPLASFEDALPEAVRLLAWLGNDHAPITAIVPDGSISTATFMANFEDPIVRHLARHNGTANLHYMVGEPMRSLHTKAKREDVKSVRAFWVDIDPKPGEPLEAERARILAVVQAYHLEPSAIIDSGGGFQALWKLKEPFEINGEESRWTEFERYNRALAHDLGGDSCWSVEHLLRLPGTINVPNAAKRARGRIEAQARIVYLSDHTFPLSAFRMGAPEPVARAVAPVRLSANLPLAEVDELPVPPWVKSLIREGKQPGDHYPSRSEAVFAVTARMIEAGCSDDVIAAVLLDPENGISAHVLERGGRRPERYAARTIERAHRVVISPENDARNIAELEAAARFWRPVPFETLRDTLRRYEEAGSPHGGVEEFADPRGHRWAPLVALALAANANINHPSTGQLPCPPQHKPKPKPKKARQASEASAGPETKAEAAEAAGERLEGDGGGVAREEEKTREAGAGGVDLGPGERGIEGAGPEVPFAESPVRPPEPLQRTGAAPLPLFHHGEAEVVGARWTVRNRIPERGAGLLIGQWGTYKTFLALDLAAHIILDWDWAGEPIYRRGGVLIFAGEGAAGLPLRLKALVENLVENDGRDMPPSIDPKHLPIAWTDRCPWLLGEEDEDPIPTLVATAEVAAERFQADCGLPLALILIDTMAVAARFKDENNNGEGSRAMAVLQDLSRLTGAVVVGVDHLGKNVEAGARGASAKEANADFILAVHADREPDTGKVRDTSLVLRKMRDGPQGEEIPFAAKAVDMGADERDYPVTSVVIDWNVRRETKTTSRKGPTYPQRLLREAVANVRHERGVTIELAAGGEEKAALKDDVRESFRGLYRLDSKGEERKITARDERFRTSLRELVDRGDIGAEKIDGIEYLWPVFKDEM